MFQFRFIGTSWGHEFTRVCLRVLARVRSREGFFLSRRNSTFLLGLKWFGGGIKLKSSFLTNEPAKRSKPIESDKKKITVAFLYFRSTS